MQATLYAIYKVPIDQAMALAAYGWSQGAAFIKWFSDGKSDSNTSQFVAR